MANSAVVGTLRALLVADTAEFDQAMQRAATTSKALGKEFKAIGKDATAVGQTLTAAITLPLVALGGVATKLASDFESSFAGVRKTVDATEAEFAQLETQFRDLAKTIPVNVNEINKLGEAAGALGIPKEDIKGFVEVMAGLGVATDLTADQAANAVARIQNIFGAAGKDTDRFASTLVALGNAGASTEKEIVEMAQRIAGAGHTVGLTQAQVLAFASTLASVGINAEAGGSAISRVFLKINAAVGEGGKELAKFAAAAKMSTADFKHAFETDAAGAVQKLIGEIGKLGRDAGPVIQSLLGKNIILTDTILRVAGAGELLTDQLNLANKAWQENTALTDETSKRYETFASQVTILWNKLQDIGITLGQALLPVMRDLLKLFDNFLPLLEGAVKWFGELPGPVKTLAIVLAGVAAAAGPLLMLFGAMATGLGTLMASFASGGIVVTAFTATLAFLLNPITLVVAALGVLALGIYTAATAETVLEKELRETGKAFHQQTAELDIALAAYEDLSQKQHLTTEETKELDRVTRLLAEASGMSEEAFRRETEKSDALTRSLHAQLEEREDLRLEQIRQAGVARTAAEREYIRLLERQEDIRQRRATKVLPVGEFGAVTERPLELGEQVAELNALVAPIAKAKQAADEARQVHQALSGALDQEAMRARELAAAFPPATAATQKNTKATTAGADASEKGAKAAQKYADSVRDLADTFTGKKLADEVKKLDDMLRLVRETGARLDFDKVRAEIERLVKAGATLTPVLRAIADANTAAQAAEAAHLASLRAEGEQVYRTALLAEQMEREFKDVAAAIRLLETTEINQPLLMPKTWAQLQTEMDKTGAEITALVRELEGGPGGALEQGLKAGALRFAEGLPQLLTAAFEGGGQAFGKQLGALVAEAIGAAIGPAIAKAIQGAGASPALSSAISIPIIGLFVAGFADMFQQIGRARGAHERYLQGVREMTADLHAQLVGPNGPYQDFQALEQAANDLGVTFEDVWNTDGVTVFGHQLQERIDEFKKLQKAAAEWERNVTGAIDRLGGTLEAFGGKVPTSLRPMVATLLESRDLTEDMRAELEGLAGDPSWRTLQQTAEKYGIELSTLGAKFQKERITDTALEYARDFQMLIDFGADLTGVVGGAKDELNALYRDAKKNGVALPETLRPYMQRLADMGELVDENGEKITDLNGITFEDIEDKLLTQVVDVLKEIRDLLAKSLPEAADQGAKGIQEAFDRNKPRLTIPVDYDYGDPDRHRIHVDPGDGPELGLQGGTHGQYVDWGAGTTVRLHDKERVMTEGEALGGGAINITVISQLDGREVARNQVRHIPRALQLAGL